VKESAPSSPPVSLRLPSGSFGDSQTGAPDSARLDACSPHQCVCVPLDAAVTPCNDLCCRLRDAGDLVQERRQLQ